MYNKQKHVPKLKLNILGLVNDLNQKNIKQYVVSAQKNQTLLGLVSFYGLKNSFVKVVGVSNDLALGKKTLAEKLKNKFCKNKKVLVVGDTVLDFEVSKHIGGSCVLVDWGHYSFSRLSACDAPVFRSVEDLKSFFIKELELTSL